MQIFRAESIPQPQDAGLEGVQLAELVYSHQNDQGKSAQKDQ